MEQRMQLIQKQSLKLAPVMQMSVNILQLPLLQLLHRIEIELTENPLLERDEEPVEREEEGVIASEGIGEEVDWNSYLEGMEEGSAEREAGPDYENILSQHISLKDYLLSQLHLLRLGEKERRIGEIIIDAINEDGYLSSSTQSIAMGCGVGIEVVEKILGYIQEFEPVGIGARDLREALLIQARYLGWDENGDLIRLIKYHLRDVQLRNYARAAKDLGIGIDEVKGLVERLRILEPKPSRLYREENPPYITPDILVRSVDGNFIVELNDACIPRLRVNPYYKEILKNEKDTDVLSYIREKMNAASWFLRCVEERRRTILNVAEEIFRRQADFLHKGPSWLQPLRMQDIADTLNINESTVSRATSNKYVQTPWGIFPLKFFFTTGLTMEEGKRVSSGHIKERIKALIEEESSDAPLTDQQIVSRLNHEGLRVARRTVTKYRVAMGILPSNLRKR
jgi:RNA polymerase sigma-54 factor